MHADIIISPCLEQYSTNPEAKKAIPHEQYTTNPETKKAVIHEQYSSNTNTNIPLIYIVLIQRQRKQLLMSYISTNSEKVSHSWQLLMHNIPGSTNPGAKKAGTRAQYSTNPERKR